MKFLLAAYLALAVSVAQEKKPPAPPPEQAQEPLVLQIAKLQRDMLAVDSNTEQMIKEYREESGRTIAQMRVRLDDLLKRAKESCKAGENFDGTKLACVAPPAPPPTKKPEPAK